jgi:hypothetical protein
MIHSQVFVVMQAEVFIIRPRNSQYHDFYLWPYSPLLGIGRFVSFFIFTESVAFLGR